MADPVEDSVPVRFCTARRQAVHQLQQLAELEAGDPHNMVAAAAAAWALRSALAIACSVLDEADVTGTGDALAPLLDTAQAMLSALTSLPSPHCNLDADALAWKELLVAAKCSVSARPHEARCATCGATEDLEPDEDNPETTYCVSCWEAYSVEHAQYEAEARHDAALWWAGEDTKSGRVRYSVGRLLELRPENAVAHPDIQAAVEAAQIATTPFPAGKASGKGKAGRASKPRTPTKDPAPAPTPTAANKDAAVATDPSPETPREEPPATSTTAASPPDMFFM